MSKFSIYLKDQFKLFDRSSLWSPDIVKQAGVEIVWWLLSTTMFVLLVTRYQKHLPFEYLTKAISEGIGPHLWNVIGVFALSLVGLTFLFPRFKFLANAAHNVLVNTHAIGAMSFGLLFGQFFSNLTVWSENLELWQSWFLGAGGVFLLIYALLLNFSLWYLGHLMSSHETDSVFLHLISKVDLRIRVSFFLLLAVLPVTLLLLEN